MFINTSPEKNISFNQATPKRSARLLCQLINCALIETNNGMMSANSTSNNFVVNISDTDPIQHTRTFGRCNIQLDGVPNLRIELSYNPRGNFNKFLSHQVCVPLYENYLDVLISNKITEIGLYFEEGFRIHDLSWDVQETKALKCFLAFLNALKDNICPANSSLEPRVLNYTPSNVNQQPHTRRITVNSKAMLNEANTAIIKQLTKLSKGEKTVITNLITRYDDIEVTALTEVIEFQFDCLDMTHVLSIGKCDEEELHNIETIINNLSLKDTFNRTVDAITLGDVVSSRAILTSKVISALEYYKDAFTLILDVKEKVLENDDGC